MHTPLFPEQANRRRPAGSPCVGGVLVNGALGPGEDDGLLGVLDEVGKAEAV